MDGHAVILVSMRMAPEDGGVHELVFRLGAPEEARTVRVLILQSAYRRLADQLRMAGLYAPRVAEPAFLADWARWHLWRYYRPGASIPAAVTITLGDVDAYGRYSRRVGQSLQAA